MLRSWSLVACAIAASTCSHERSGDPAPAPVSAVPGPSPTATTTVAATPSPTATAASSATPAAPIAVADAAPDAPPDPNAIHYTTQPDLLKLVWLPPGEPSPKRDLALAYLVAPAPGHFNQGNLAMAHHAISKAKCLEGLRGITLQTDEQRAVCGAPNMVPVYANGDPRSAKVCIDVFEFPNQACELPFVWGSPSEAETMCRIEGKRLCTQQEWSLACAADPQGKEKWPYAYGTKLDLAVCHTNEPKELAPDGKTWVCNVHDAQTTWNTCSTDTEPSGAFPKCRSRLGVFDQHGNVAEEMTRKEGDEVFTQLKGSAWFYVDVGREPGKPAWHPERESYPDTCNYDPRWHVEHLKESLHVNYHLGFRCCKDVPR